MALSTSSTVFIEIFMGGVIVVVFFILGVRKMRYERRQKEITIMSSLYFYMQRERIKNLNAKDNDDTDKEVNTNV